MAIDLSGLQRGSVWRVRCRNGERLWLTIGGSPPPYIREWPHLLSSGISVDDSGFAGANHQPWRNEDVVEILHELKPVADITAADLDGMVIETADGGKVFFADGHARMETADECLLGTWGGNAPPKWARGRELADEVAAYAAELERRRNPPVEIVWQDVLRIADVIAQAHCTVRGDIWRISHTEQGGYRIHCGLEYMAIRSNHTQAEQYIRDHYKDRATST